MGLWKSIGRIASYPVLHPQRTLRGMGKTTSSVVVGVGAGYVGWEKLTTDKSLSRIVGDAVIGEETCDTVGETVSSVTKLPGKALDTINGFTQSVDGATSRMSGIGNFVSSLTNGNLLDGIGNFFNNIGNGKVSGTSLLGLVASAFLLFGRFGWFGKIAGAILGMMILGNNMSASQFQARQLPDTPEQGNAQQAKPMPSAPQQPTIHR